MNDPLLTRLPVLRLRGDALEPADDPVAVEEPLDLRVQLESGDESLNVTMRTPGADRQLALGWLYAEGLLTPNDLPDMSSLPDAPNVLLIRSSDPQRLLSGARRHVTSSACGVCGSGSVERLLLRVAAPVWTAGPLSPARLLALPDRLRAAQPAFRASGGLHAAGLFTAQGELRAAYEDVGRHNAVDKLVGHALQAGWLPLHDRIVVTSSRAGFEIVQKAALAGAAVVLTVGAPSSLAVETAAGLGLTLIGFVREGRMNVYAGAERLQAGVQ
ncbi:formate dehydrogenase accessory sulfurtransferase FdhD [Deinococcus sonorensis]|uniref:Sulfur carrier protein FdhD n=2 Tax=Deinococcus sonorensis TaxID=309891 RepID=A0AAU7UBQ3_9DEIO